MKNGNVSEPEESILAIDTTVLDKEWINQPRLFFRYAKELADAKQKLEEANANVKLVIAEADKKVRFAVSDQEKKPPEAAIAQQISRRKEVKAAEQDALIAKHQVDVLYAAVNALEHRKSALENLVKLHGQNYFSTPRADGDNKEVVADLRMRRSAKKG